MYDHLRKVFVSQTFFLFTINMTATKSYFLYHQTDSTYLQLSRVRDKMRRIEGTKEAGNSGERKENTEGNPEKSEDRMNLRVEYRRLESPLIFSLMPG